MRTNRPAATMLSVAAAALLATRITGCGSVHTDCQVTGYKAEVLVRSTSGNPAKLRSVTVTLLDGKGRAITSFGDDLSGAGIVLAHQGDSVPVTVPLKGVHGAYKAVKCTASTDIT